MATNMPQAAIDTGPVDEVLPAKEIGRLLVELAAKGKAWSAMRCTMQDMLRRAQR